MRPRDTPDRDLARLATGSRPRASLRLSDRPPVRGCVSRQPATTVMVRRHEQSAAMTFGEDATLDRCEGVVRQIKQSEEVRHRDARATDPPTDLLARETELLDESGARAGLLDRVEVLPGHVLDQRELQ